MTIAAKRERLHQYIDSASNVEVVEMLWFIENELSNKDDYVLSSEQEKVLMERDDANNIGEMKTSTIEEVKARLNFKD